MHRYNQAYLFLFLQYYHIILLSSFMTPMLHHLQVVSGIVYFQKTKRMFDIFSKHLKP